MTARTSVNLRERAEAAFDPLRRPAPEIPVNPCHAALMPEWFGVAKNIQTCAWRIATLKTMEARQQVWIVVPVMWRTEVRDAVALLLAGTYGTCARIEELVTRISTEVPIELQAAVREKALVVWRMGRGG